METNVIFRREFRRQLWSWIPALLVVLWYVLFMVTMQEHPRWSGDKYLAGELSASDASFLMGLLNVVLVLACIVSSYSAMREEKDGQTLELLATTPAGGPSLMVNIALGRSLGWIAWGVPCVVALSLKQPDIAIAWYSVGICLALALSVLAAMGCLQLGTGPLTALLGFLPGAIVLGGLAVFAGSVISTCPIPSADVGILTAGAFAAWLFYSGFQLLGGQWPETVLHPPSVRPRIIETAPGGLLASRWWGPVPDGVHPIMWRELQAELIPAGLIGLTIASMVILCAHSVGCVTQAGVDSFLGALAMAGSTVLLVHSATRIARDREEGFFEDLSMTPLSPLGITASRLGGIVARGAVALVPSLVVLYLFPGHPGHDVELTSTVAMALAVLWLFTLASLCGLLGGLLTRGWKASFAGALVAYLIGLVSVALGTSLAPTCLNWVGMHGAGYSIRNTVEMVLSLLCALPLAWVVFLICAGFTKRGDAR